MATLVSIDIKPDAGIIYLGDTVQYQCLATYSDGTVVDVTELTTWSLSGSPSIAEFDGTTNGLLISKSIGDASVGADYSTVSDTTTITIHNPLIMAIPADLVGLYRPETQDYLDLITSQYQNSPKFLEWVRTFLAMVEDIRDLAQNLSFYFSFNQIVSPTSATLLPSGNDYLTVKDGDFDFVAFDAAVGDQLDILGVILGQSRTVDFNPSGGVSPTLDDNTYRILLKNKALINQWNGMSDALQTFWQTVFPGGKVVVQDNQNMTFDIILVGAFSSIIVDLIANGYIVPRPQGVLVNYYYGETPFFGHDHDDAYISGHDVGNWV